MVRVRLLAQEAVGPGGRLAEQARQVGSPLPVLPERLVAPDWMVRGLSLAHAESRRALARLLPASRHPPGATAPADFRPLELCAL